MFKYVFFFQQEITNLEDDSLDKDKCADDDDDDFLTASPASSMGDKIGELELSMPHLENNGNTLKCVKTDAESKLAAENRELSFVLNNFLNGTEHADVSKSLGFDDSASLTVDGVDIDNIMLSLESPNC